MLLTKSQRNKEIANYAETTKKYYEVAVSRYYYSIYQKIIHFIESKQSGWKPQKGQDSHILTIAKLIDLISKEPNFIPSVDDIKLEKIKTLKKDRMKADYINQKYKKSAFLATKIIYNEILAIFSKFNI